MIGLEPRMQAFVDGCVGHLKHDKKVLGATLTRPSFSPLRKHRLEGSRGHLWKSLQEGWLRHRLRQFDNTVLVRSRTGQAHYRRPAGHTPQASGCSGPNASHAQHVALHGLRCQFAGDIGLLDNEIFVRLVDDGDLPEKCHQCLVLCASLGALFPAVVREVPLRSLW